MSITVTRPNAQRSRFAELIYKANGNDVIQSKKALESLLKGAEDRKISMVELSDLVVQVPLFGMMLIKDGKFNHRVIDNDKNTLTHRIVAVNAHAALYLVTLLPSTYETCALANKQKVTVAHIAALHMEAAHYMLSRGLLLPLIDEKHISVQDVARNTLKMAEAFGKLPEPTHVPQRK